MSEPKKKNDPSQKIIITCAVTGGIHTPTMSDALPITPDQIADELADLSAAGLRGIAISFVNYLDELPYFLQEVIPRLQKKGLRT